MRTGTTTRACGLSHAIVLGLDARLNGRSGKMPSGPGGGGTTRLLAALLCALLPLSQPAAAHSGRVIDAVSRQPIPGALVTLHDKTVRADGNGLFEIHGEGERIGIRAYGYRRAEVAAGGLGNGQDIPLAPFRPKALYLSFFGIGNTTLRQSALKLIRETELNALVMDVKGDRGMVAYRSAVPLAARVGAQKLITVRDLKGLIASLRQAGIYTIARIVVYKDDPLASARPDLALKTPSGQIWRDREGLAWVDPFKQEVRDYNIAIAVEAARNGFDEIQFDYVRFPDAQGLRFSTPGTEQSRIKAVSQFLVQARQALTPYNVFLAADIFGYVCWNLNDTGIGQRLEDLAPLVDYVSPMLYPSGFRYGIPGYPNPVANPYEVVYLSLKRAEQRTHLPPERFRPWLQAFKDYAFDRRPFREREIREQVRAAEASGADGWMMWNPRNVYSAEGLRKE